MHSLTSLFLTFLCVENLGKTFTNLLEANLLADFDTAEFWAEAVVEGKNNPVIFLRFFTLSLIMFKSKF